MTSVRTALCRERLGIFAAPTADDAASRYPRPGVLPSALLRLLGSRHAAEYSRCETCGIQESRRRAAAAMDDVSRGPAVVECSRNAVHPRRHRRPALGFGSGNRAGVPFLFQLLDRRGGNGLSMSIVDCAIIVKPSWPDSGGLRAVSNDTRNRFSIAEMATTAHSPVATSPWYNRPPQRDCRALPRHRRRRDLPIVISIAGRTGATSS